MLHSSATSILQSMKKNYKGVDQEEKLKTSISGNGLLKDTSRLFHQKENY